VVGEAADGQESVQQVEHCRPNVVLMDMQMPGTNGLEATRRIKCRWPKVKIIALTLHPRYQAEAFAAGADAFLLKGCDPELLRDAILASAPGRACRFNRKERPMRVCVSSTGTTLDAPIDPRFGRCAYFLFVDSETLEFESVENPNARESGGAGIVSAQFVANRGAGAVVTGRVGPNAERALRSARIEVVAVSGGTAREAVEAFRNRPIGVKDNTPPAPRGQGEQHGRGQGLGRGRRRGAC
jgi:predicted Fe-Mo cluster-binding NifX family protein/CheY-like chemotaxis protein